MPFCEDKYMPDLPANVSIQELINEAVSKMTSATSDDSRQDPRPWDCAFMEFLTANAWPNPFNLIVGENYIGEVQKHAYYYSSVLGRKCWYICLGSTPMLNLLSMLNLASGVPRRNLLDLKIPPPYFAALNEGWRNSTIPIAGILSRRPRTWPPLSP